MTGKWLGRRFADVRHFFRGWFPASEPAMAWNGSHNLWNDPKYLERRWDGNGYTAVKPGEDDSCCGSCGNGCWSE